MRIAEATWWIERFPLGEPYRIAYDHVTAAENVIVRLVTADGTVGLGVGCPETPLTGETAATIGEGLAEILPGWIGRDALEPARLIQEVRGDWPGRPALRAALDLALHDVLGKVAGLPLWRLLGGYRSAIDTSLTLGILDPTETVERARAAVSAGFRTLKLKGGLDAERDVQRVREVRAALGPGIELWLDPNQGYTVGEATRVARQLAGTISLLEQPTPREDPEQIAAVALGSPVPVYADEGVMSSADALALAFRVQGVNVKVQKLGGLVEARRVTGICTAAGMGALVGCMDECALGISAGLSVALGYAAVGHADLDGHLDLTRDPTGAALTLRAGTLFPSDRPGLGLADLAPPA